MSLSRCIIVCVTLPRMARYGYARISTRSQRDDSQLDALRAAGCERIWADTASGKLARRPEWDNCLDHLRRGDELAVTRLSRMARSVRHLTEIAALLAGRGIDLVVLKQGIDTTTPAGRFTFHVLAAMDEMLADLISEGTREGLESARARGRVGGRKPKLTARQAEVARGMYDETGADGRRKYTVAEIAETFGVSRKPSTGTSNHPPAAASPVRARGRPHPPGRWPRCRTRPRPLRPRQRASRQPAGPPRCRAGLPGLPGLRARTRHQGRGAAATRGPRHRLAAPRRRPPHRGPALRGMPAARARHRRQLLLLRQRPPDHRAATRTRRPARAASAGLAARPRLATSPPTAMPRRSQIAASCDATVGMRSATPIVSTAMAVPSRQPATES